MELIDGKLISQTIKDELKARVAELKKHGHDGSLAVIQVGNDPASSIYVKNKKKACEYIGIGSVSYELSENTSEAELLTIIDELNNKPEIIGILVQLPVPKHIDEDKIIKAISPRKDVDGFHVENVGALCVGNRGFVSCTPAGVIQLLKRSNVEIAGKHCVVI
ncbi:MAG: bifunctional methylenetetrahydrofolate dehydrogenase/methenyltetrahydrofolate cyclohydrolase, partial [Lachnospiraceae bacterium]|nr:bifunctional methylenetetrahydrofolate dehydrogenase/methenyltetrahydrofolate cyclohydrolase [Lachnospiraceae bacterium]